VVLSIADLEVGESPGRKSLSGVRILHVHTLPVLSGSGANTLITMKGSRDCGAEVSLACAPGGRLEEEVRREGIGFLPIPTLVQPVWPLHDLRALWRLYRTIRRGRFDIVHTHNSKAGFLGRLAARLARCPAIIHTVHGFAFHEQVGWLGRRVYLTAERKASSWCDRMIVVSQPLRDWALRARVASAEKMRLIYSGIDIDAFSGVQASADLARSLGVKPGDMVVGIVSKLWEGKGHDLLLQSVARLSRQWPQIRLLVVGEGKLERQLRERAASLGLREIALFTGFRSDIPEITALFDIAVLPSLFEGMGRVVLEAMAAGKPVVASRVGGIPDLVQDGVTGLLFPPGDVAALTEQLGRLLNDPDLRRRMGEAGRRQVDERFSAQAMVARIHEVYAQELGRRGRGGELGG